MKLLQQIALKLYSRGLLGNVSDIRESTNPSTPPVLYATQSSNNRANVSEGLSLGKTLHISDVPKNTSGVPLVKGLGLREAVVVLERAGYNVEFEGDGYVVSQTPVAGSVADKGSCVKITLSQD